MTPKTRPQWIKDLDMYELDHSIFDWMCRADDHMDYLQEALQTCRAYAVHPVSRDDCFVIFNTADKALKAEGE